MTDEHAPDAQAVDTEIEDVESFRLRARAWLRDNMAPRSGHAMRGAQTDEQELEAMQRQRALQRQLFDAGFAGLVVEKEYGGQGLTPAHALAFSEEAQGYEHPMMLQIPNFTPCMAVILEFGTHEQKLRHVPPILKGEHVWVQYLSEPSSGSDAAGAQTTAVRDGDEWVLNGSKMWSSGAWLGDYGLTLVRTNQDVPKHRGLSVFMVPAHAPGVEMHRIEMLNGGKHFCQEFFTDVRIPESERLGIVDDGWTIGTRWLYFERSFAMSPHVIHRSGAGDPSAVAGRDLLELARRVGRIDDPIARDMLGEVLADGLVGALTQRRIGQGIRTGHLNNQAAALSRLLAAVTSIRSTTVAYELAGSGGVVYDDADTEVGRRGQGYLSRQAIAIGGGTIEMARNAISERVLGMPRERDASRELPFREVPKGPSKS